MRWTRRLRVFAEDHWIAISVSVAIAICFALTVYGMSKLESFYINMTIATLPLQILTWIFGSVISAFIYVSLLFGMFSKQNRKKIKGEQINIRFDDVIGIDEAKEEAWEVVQLLKDRARVKKVGGQDHPRNPHAGSSGLRQDVPGQGDRHRGADPFSLFGGQRLCGDLCRGRGKPCPQTL